ncbi:MAG: hypothetical protein ACD_11C00018G0004 [uncultured bacterium]|nr:MAG: hypothetical protein ACD_11C00018G0004 [uncultured bacterium]HBR71530.1 hypothetical protein [Candidatus Moranbacteria bacterium]
MKKELDKKQLSILAYKLLHDSLFWLLFSFFVALLLEAVLPGIVSQNEGFLIISFLVFANLWIISHIGRKININFNKPEKNHLFPLVILFSFLLIGNSLLKFSLWQNILITSATLLIFFFLFHDIFPIFPNKK